MKLSQHVKDETSTAMTRLKVMDTWYTTDSDNYEHEMPIIHVTGRTTEGEWEHVEIDGFRPYFLVPETGVDAEMLDSLDKDDRVKTVMGGEKGMNDEDLLKIVLYRPWDIRELRDVFDKTFEADVRFDDRFRIDKSITQWMEYPEETEGRVSHTEVSGVEVEDVVRPRICYFDIEVQQTDEGPPVVSKEGTEQARNNVTAITAYDSYKEDYKVWVLIHPEWDSPSPFEEKDVHGSSRGDEPDEGVASSLDARTFYEDRELLQSFVKYLTDRRFDVLTGWNSNNFDVPYIVNRCFERDVHSVYDISPTRQVDEMDGNGSWLNSDLKGVVCFDMLDGVRKTQIHELDSYSLKNVAKQMLDDTEKLDVEDIDDAWKTDPQKFVEYNRVDVEVVVDINKEVGIL